MDKLKEIIKEKKINLELIKEKYSIDSINKKIESQNFYYNFKDKIIQNEKISIIAEIKKASPSAGLIVKDFNHLDIAKTYSNSGAVCLSVLTEEKYFQGNPNFITEIKKNFKLPILAKDFFVDPFQVPLMKSYGCDCILIILAALSESQADEIYEEALKNNLSVIVEVHDANEAALALKYEEAIIGINNRNLKTMEVSIENTINVYNTVQYHQGPVLSESGIKSFSDAKYIYDKTGIKAFLIGESLLSSNDPSDLIKKINEII